MGCSQSTEAVPPKNIYNTQPQEQYKPPPSGNRSSVNNDVASMQHGHSSSATKSNKKGGGAHHLRNVFVPRIDQEDLSSFSPPKFEKSEEENTFLHDTLGRNFLFEHLQESELESIVSAFEKCTFPAGQNIITQGDEGDYFFIVQSGACTFQVDGNSVGSCGAGDAFGELALLYSSPRAATVIADKDAICFRLDQKTFRFVLQAQNQQSDSQKIEVLKKISFLKGLESYQLQKLSTAMTLKSFREGDFIVRKGEVGEHFFILHEGEVKVTDISVGNTKYEDFTMGPGEYFGERAIIKSEPRAANVIATTEGVVFSIDRVTFEKVLGDVAALVLRAQDKNRLGGIKCIKETYLPSATLDNIARLIKDQNYKAGATIMTEDSSVEPALYIVRSGKCKVTSRDGKNDTSVEEGAIFGEDQLTADVGKKRKSFIDGATLSDLKNADPNAIMNDEDKIVPSYTVEAVEDTLVGILTLKDMRTIIDTSLIGQGRQMGKKSKLEMAMNLDDLKRHTILGQGTFGQVWLVSHPDENNVETPYALKIQSKHELVQSQQAKGVVQEMELMAQLNHPFLLRLVRTFQDRHLIYMVLSYVQGGELYSRVHTEFMDGLPEYEAKFYAAGIAEALSFMHRQQIIYRDLKPENVLIDKEGYPTIIDFGFAKRVPENTYTFCGTPLYIAPEVVLNRGHSVGADHWSLGCLIYEMITGDTPFFEEYMDQLALYRAICSGHFRVKPLIQHKREALDLCHKFLIVEPSERLGVLKGGQMDIFSHQWFQEIDFSLLRNKAIPAPWVPKIKDALDTSNFEDWGHLESKSTTKYPDISDKDQALFSMFGQV